MDRILIIGGSTATGKSDMAIRLAEKLNGEIISADSMQIYKYMDIGTAKACESEQKGIRHHMINVVNPDSEYSVAEYSENALPIIKDILNRKKLPVIVGGTGLYIDSILYPLNFSNAKTDIAIRNKLQNELEDKGKEYMYQKLMQSDSKRASELNINDTKRVLRALELLEAGIVPSENTDNIKPRFNACLIGLSFDRSLLYEKINKRVDIMFASGLEDELKNLLKNGLCNFSSQSMQAIGYKEFKKYYEKEISIDEVKELIKKNTRNYAKRQITWFKKYKDLNWVDVEDKDTAFQQILEIYYNN